jgi:hypothetical protein
MTYQEDIVRPGNLLRIVAPSQRIERLRPLQRAYRQNVSTDIISPRGQISSLDLLKRFRKVDVPVAFRTSFLRSSYVLNRLV